MATARPAWRRAAQAGLLSVAGLLLAACAVPRSMPVPVTPAPAPAVAPSAPPAPAAGPAPVPDAAAAPAPASAGLVVLQRTVTGRTVFAILPPQARDPGVEGAAEAQAHVRFALADTRRCLGSAPVRLETVFADRLVLQSGSRNESFAPDPTGPGIGAVLVEPGRAGRMVQSMVGASSLPHQLPQAVSVYWNYPACKRE